MNHTGRRQSGALLLEAVLAIGLLVVGSLTILSILSRALTEAEIVIERQHATDLCRSAIALMEAGIEGPESLNGPVPAWTDETSTNAFEDDLPEPTDWELAVEVEPSEFDGLTLVSVSASVVPPTGEPRAVYTLTQLVRLYD